MRVRAETALLRRFAREATNLGVVEEAVISKKRGGEMCPALTADNGFVDLRSSALFHFED